MSIYIKAEFEDGFTYIFEKDNICYENDFDGFILKHGNIVFLHLVLDD